ncbi:MAG: hypothetical protein UY76_C0034G0010 [Candidatus Uhrbacteria bacterium GW2011_GWA2_52_8d]|uniref:Uncharacterized protein n=1 Tax=Candidatus Uhrbacteria bacterium GW2011_GWA2_52_8d TaxID=1618979 RepID=A0A0G1XLW3_9BACT|nr:MAG: hypothetical protein UY76_C0034G0010 [Candidatus Uhrbacteria bacterium GW2011_GWA2_52_8d]
MPGAALMFRNPDTLTSPRRAFRSPNGGFYMTSSVTWDYLRFWRQLLLVRHCDWTDEFLFQNVMELVCTRKHGTFTDRSGGDFDRLLSSIRGGYRTIEQVMSLSVPDWLVDRMLAMWRTPGIVPVPQVLVRELSDPDAPARRERVRRRHHEHELVLVERRRLDVRMAWLERNGIWLKQSTERLCSKNVTPGSSPNTWKMRSNSCSADSLPGWHGAPFEEKRSLPR